MPSGTPLAARVALILPLTNDMTTPETLKIRKLKGQIKKWIKRKQPPSQNQTSPSVPPPMVSPSSSSVPNQGQHPSQHTLSNPNIVAGSSQATGPGTQVISSPMPAGAGPFTSGGLVANIGSTGVTVPLTNPTPPLTSTTSARWAGLDRFASVLTSVSNTFGPIKDIVNELVECVNIYEMAAKNKNEYKALQDELEHLFTELQGQLIDADAMSSTGTNMDPITESLCKCIKDELEAVKVKQVGSGLKHNLRAGGAPEEVLACYQRVHGHLIRLSVYISSSAKKDLDKQAIALQKQAENAHTDRVSARLDRLRPSLSACYNSAQAAELKRGECTPGTRMDTLARMHNHASDSGSGAIFWLNGMAGTGKTTIAYTFCTELNSKRQLAASFFCSRLLPECRDVNLVIPSIAYQLGRYSRSFQSALFKALEADPDIHTRSLHTQFEDLIFRPLFAIQRNNDLPPNSVVVIDALDECENKESTAVIIDILLSKSSNLPVKIFFSSRPEPEIRDAMTKRLGDNWTARLVLHELDKSMVQADIERYLRMALARLELSNEVFAELARDAGVLFIYAATVVRYIAYSNFNQNPRGRLETVLSASGPGAKQKNKAIDGLYTAIINRGLEDEELDDMERDDILKVLHTIVCAQEPLSIGALSGLLQFRSVDRTRAAIRPLWSVLHVTGASELVTTLHASFPDYILDGTRSGRYHCNPKLHHYSLSRLCFDAIQGAPPFNICGLKSSFIRDRRVVDLDTRVANVIPSELFYACRYWGTHVNISDDLPGLGSMVSGFLSTRLLLWLEVMNLKKSVRIAVDVMKRVNDWSTRRADSEELSRLVDDARCFTTAFASTPVSQSTPHLYLSMLPFWPPSRPVSQVYAKNFVGLPRAEGTAVDRRQLALLATWSFGHISKVERLNAIKSAVFSPDGRHIALATHDQVLVIDSLTGQQLGRPLKGHARAVLSVEYSIDGNHIISSSASGILIQDAKSGKTMSRTNIGGRRNDTSVHLSPDGTHIISCLHWSIYVWDARSGDQVLGPLEGHTGSINVIRYSPDGRHIVSGACDKTLRVWDARNGQVITIIRDSASIQSVGFPPSGTHIVFGSAGATIRVWCTLKKVIVLGPIEGHTGGITSITYSPSGKHIASGSEDKTIRIWDSQRGDMILGPLEGHTGAVLSIAYSLDGSQIVSSSSDNRIRVWDACIKGLILNPPNCHTGVVTSVACSPDGTRICSSSEDKTICIWGSEHGNLILGPLKGHTDSVEFVCYSPNGACIASGSRDKTVRVWSAQIGVVSLGPLEGHTGPITSICYSPDGAQIASGSKDATIRVWDTRNGCMVLGPLEPEGHTRLTWIVSVRYSPDGTRILGASGSDHKDMGIQIWDSQSGDMVLVAKYGNRITSLEYSSDGTRFIFGSTDNTIRVCNSQTGGLVHQIGARAPGAKDIKFHTITSVKYSPAGSYIVSGSDDKTVTVWDAQNGVMVLGPLVGHIDRVNTVGYSPNGAFVVSGSSDTTIRVWKLGNRNQPAPRPTSVSAHAKWELNPDGWAADSRDRSKTLLWVPYDMRGSLIRSEANTLVISRNGYVLLNFDNTYLGEEWAKCYAPIP